MMAQANCPVGEFVSDRERASRTTLAESSHLQPAVRVLDPLCDSRWGEFLDRHPNAGLFHSTGWLEALRRTYGYQPMVITTSAPDEALSNGIVVCMVRSWVTGSRLVSLPFSDHCDPLVDNTRELEVLLSFLKAQVDHGTGRYLEIRPSGRSESGILKEMHLEQDDEYCVHYLDLSPALDDLFRRFHRSCVQRKIRKAERARLHYEEGRSEELLSKFYKLLLRTRRRHQLPPQSFGWFRNLADCLGDVLKVRIVLKEDRPIAAAITTQLRDTSVYKYACSDDAYHNLGGTCLLIWRAILDAKAAGASRFDFGRSDRHNQGLTVFKDRWGAIMTPLAYHRYPTGVNARFQSVWKHWLSRRTCACLPNSFLATAGRVLYRQVG
jgi:CelD/BcsL family acetyltransferase involved in cellulose biosynthesis